VLEMILVSCVEEKRFVGCWYRLSFSNVRYVHCVCKMWGIGGLDLGF
jgi:hypothetical protein